MRLAPILLYGILIYLCIGLFGTPVAADAFDEHAEFRRVDTAPSSVAITTTDTVSPTASTGATDDAHLPQAPLIHPRVLIDPAALQAAKQPIAPAPAPIAPTVPITSLSAVSNPAEPSPAWSATENYLILGTDRRAGTGAWRTDVVMVLGLDRANQKAALLSVPRDLYIQIPGYGWGRINQVDYLGENVLRVEGGGPALVSAVLDQTLGISTEHWVRVDMQGLVALVDTLGGVTVHLDCPFYEPIFNLDTNQWDYFTLPAGDVHMDGETAHWFTRLRLRESDIGRSQRQRQFLWALRDQMLRTEQLTRLPQIWSDLSDMFTTDLTLAQMVDLVRLGMTFSEENVRAAGITLRELQSYRTEQGAAVLRIADPYTVRAVVDGVWEAAPMAAAYAHDANACPPLPAGVPSMPEQLTPAPNTATLPDAESNPEAAIEEPPTADGS